MVSSSKGGVGKTSVAVNLATALQIKGAKTLLIAGDNVNPFIFDQKYIKKPKASVMSWINRESNLEDAIAEHTPTGLHIIGDTDYTEGTTLPDQHALGKLLGSLLGSTDYFLDQFKEAKYDCVVTDTRPGYNMFDLTNKISEALLVTLLDSPSLLGIRKISEEYRRLSVTCKLAANYFRSKGYETQLNELKKEYKDHAVFVLPYDEVVPESAHEGVPAVYHDPKAPFSKEVLSMAEQYITVLKTKRAPI